jgi:tRNA A37 N6-isopentenylltransferase MiaA
MLLLQAMKRKTSSQNAADRYKPQKSDEELRAERNKRLEELFAKIDRGPARKVGRLKREEIYEP